MGPACRRACAPRLAASSGRSPPSALVLVVWQHRLHLLHEIAHVLEFAVNRCEPNIGDLIQSLEIIHRRLAQDGCWHLAPVAGVDLRLDTADNGIDLILADGALVAGPLQPAAQLLALKVLARLVLFHYLEGRLLDGLHGKNAPLAGRADPPSAHRKTVGRT